MGYDQDMAQGFAGVQVDLTPSEHYTVAGVIAGESVPETAADPAAAHRDATNPLAG